MMQSEASATSTQHRDCTTLMGTSPLSLPSSLHQAQAGDFSAELPVGRSHYNPVRRAQRLVLRRAPRRCLSSPPAKRSHGPPPVP